MERGQKRTLSESSTGSEDQDSPTRFKIPRNDSHFDQPLFQGFQQPVLHRRESQASTVSSTSVSVSEDDELDGQQLSQALDSNSESTDDEPQTQNEISVPRTSKSAETGHYSTFAQKMMSKMGHKEGKGLGVKGQGIVEPVGISKQKGRRGLGLILEGLEEERVEWDSSKEHIIIEEPVEWMPQCLESCPKTKELRSWRKEGPRKTTIEDETQFCDEEVLSSVLKCKSIFDKLEPEELRKARTRSNPFETIRGVFFLNRAAMKMANMDAVFDFMFTEPKYSDGTPMVNQDNPLLYFADVCAGPGGFSEYVLWRKKWRAKGFGFTLRGQNDFKLEDFFAGPPETFEPHYGVNGREGDGNVFNEDNIEAFKKFVLDNTDGKGVHFMMADGGFSVEGQENIQEILSKQLYLCQFLVALSIVRTGGHFVCKVFDLFTPFSVGLVYLMYRAFDHVCIHKPNTSRPANSERYLICKGKKEGAAEIAKYMFEINSRINEFGFNQLGLTNSPDDILEVVPMKILMRDEEFVEYIKKSNNVIGEWQIVGLAKIAAFCKDPSLREDRQTEIKDQCLHFWKIPNQARKAPSFEKPQNKVRDLLATTDVSFLSSEPRELTFPSLEEAFKTSSPFDWKFILLGTDKKTERGYFLGTGRSRNYFLKSGGTKWEKPDDRAKFDLPANSLIYAEIVQEMRGEGRNMRRMYAIHIIDAIFLGGEDLRSLDFKSRLQLCKTFAKAINKPSLPDFATIRAKEVFGLENLKQTLGQMQIRILKGQGMRERLTSDIETHFSDPAQTRYFAPAGVLMFRIVKEPFMIAISKTQQRKYWFNTHTRKSIFECPREAAIDFKTSFVSRLAWNWDDNIPIGVPQSAQSNPNRLQAESILNFIHKKLN